MTSKKSKPEEDLRSGRFVSEKDPSMEKLSHSLHFDKKLYAEDIQGSIAHSHALLESGVLKPAEFKKIKSGLMSIKKDLDKGKSLFHPHDEDIHMAVERILTKRIGSTGKKLHTGRSRNDQVTTDMRLYIMNRCKELKDGVLELQKNILEKAEQYQKDIMPGYTHLQQAQPVYIAHYLLSFFWALERDKTRLNQAMHTADEMPLGSGALAGSGFAYNRKIIADKLGFSRISANSIDATAHRDFVMELLGTCAILGSLLSRYAEDFVIWNSQEFGFLELEEGFTTGSSMMPQKKNPDSMELIRGKAGRLLGNFCSVYTAVKGAPLCYSRDLQEDKEPLFDSVETLTVSLRVMAKAVRSLNFKTEIINKKLNNQILATDLADYLTESGIPFRESHNLVGELVKNAEKAGCAITELSDKFWSKIPDRLELQKKLNLAHSLDRRNIEGGTGQKSVKKQLARAGKILRSTGLIDS
jgi:argininosuccinate lyase